MSYLPYGIIYKDPETAERLYSNISGNVVSSFFGNNIPLDTFLKAGKKATMLLGKSLSPEEYQKSYDTFMKSEVFDMDKAVKKNYPFNG